MRLNLIDCKTVFAERRKPWKVIHGIGESVSHLGGNRCHTLNCELSIFNLSYSLERVKLEKVNNDILSALWAVWGLINNFCAILSWLNNIFYEINWGSNLQEVFLVPIIPENLHNTINICS